MRLSFIILTLFIFLGVPSLGQAQSGYCDKAKNTTDMVNCVNRHYEDAQDRLNKAFDKTLGQNQGEAAEGLRTVQGSWLVYRDLQCNWEAAQVETKAVKRLIELSCLANLTEGRADTLAAGLNDEDAQHKFSTYPRWMNVLAQENPGIYWRYGEPVRADLDCDGQNEQIMVGVDVVGNDKIETETGKATYKSEVIIAVAENPVTGKPQTQLFRLSAKDADGRDSVCNPDVEIALVDYPAALVPQSDAGTPDITNCHVALKISDNQCQPLTFYWSGKDYQFNSASTGP